MSGQVRNSIIMGLGPQALEGPGLVSGSNVAFPLEIYQTNLLDLTIPHLNIELVPAKPGHIPIQLSRNWIVESRSGTQVTPAQFQAGSNAAHNNYNTLSSTPSNANVNGSTPIAYLLGGTAQPMNLQLFPNTPIMLDVISGASGTGGFSLKARYDMHILWVAVGG